MIGIGFILQAIVAVAITAALVIPALIVRKRFETERPRVAIAAIIGASVLALVIVVLVLRAWSAHQYRRRFDTVFDQLCETPAAGDESAQAFHELACSPDVRVADLRGASEYQGVWVHLAAHTDKLDVFAPRPDLIPALAAGKVFHLWLLDGKGDVVDHIILDRTMTKLALNRPHVAEAVKAAITVDAANATKPSTAILAQAGLSVP